MKIIITRGCRIGGESHQPSDKPVEVSKKDGDYLVAIGKAKAASKAEKAEKADK